MKAKLLVLTLAAVLASCAGKANNGTKVDQAKFMEECGKIEEHTYAKATVKMKGTLKEGETEVKMDYEFKFVWDAVTESFKFEEGTEPGTDDINKYQAGQQCRSQISMTLRDMLGMYDPDDPLPPGYKYDYYINPFRVVGDIDTTTMSQKSDVKYDKYGYIVYQKNNQVYKATNMSTNYTANVKYADA